MSIDNKLSVLSGFSRELDGLNITDQSLTDYVSTRTSEFKRIFRRFLNRGEPVSVARAENYPGWFVTGYGTQRQLPVPLGSSELKDRVLNRLEPLFGKAPLVGTGFANQFADTPFFAPFIRAIQKVLVESRLLPNVEAVELRGRGGMTLSLIHI